MNKSYERKLIEILENLWLNASEAQVFIAGLQIGATSIQELSKFTHINRITTHVIANKLIERKLFLETKSGKKRLVYPNKIDILNTLLQEKKIELNRIEHDIQSVKSIINLIQIKKETYPKVRFFEWWEWIIQMLKEVIQDKQDMFGISNNSFEWFFDSEITKKSYERRIPLEINTKLILEPGFNDIRYNNKKKSKYLIDVRLLNQKGIFDWWMNIWWNKVALHSYKENYVITTIIENPETAKMMKFLFETLRLQSTKYIKK